MLLRSLLICPCSLRTRYPVYLSDSAWNKRHALIRGSSGNGAFSVNFSLRRWILPSSRTATVQLRGSHHNPLNDRLTANALYLLMFSWNMQEKNRKRMVSFFVWVLAPDISWRIF